MNFLQHNWTIVNLDLVISIETTKWILMRHPTDIISFRTIDRDIKFEFAFEDDFKKAMDKITSLLKITNL